MCDICESTIIAFYKNHSQFNALLSGHNVPSNRFIRLMCLPSVEVLFNIPCFIFDISLLARSPLNSYISWESVHFKFSHVQEIPSLIWHSSYEGAVALELSRWGVVFCAFVFIFFGFADEVRKNYRYAFQSVAKHVGLSTGSSFGNGINSSDFLGSSGCVKIILLLFDEVFSFLFYFFQNEKIKNYWIIRENSSCSSLIRSPRHAQTPQFHGLHQQHVNRRR